MKFADAMTPEQLSQFMDLVCANYGVCLPPDARRSILDHEALEVNAIPRLLVECEGPGEWWDRRLLRSIRDELEKFRSRDGWRKSEGFI
jgi:hypothetical protein